MTCNTIKKRIIQVSKKACSKFDSSTFKYSIIGCLFLISALLVFGAVFYWEEPIVISSADSRFPSSAHQADTSVVVWQDVNTNNNTIMLSARIFSGGGWKDHTNFAGPFTYSGEIPNIISVAVNKENTVVVTALSSVSALSIYTLDDISGSFTQDNITSIEYPMIGARVFSLSDGSFTILATEADETGEDFSLISATSKDGVEWSDFDVFAPANAVGRSFVPTIVNTPTGDMVIFQTAYVSNFQTSYQLYSSITTNGGSSWTEPRLMTDFTTSTIDPFTSFNNQRAKATVIDGVTHVVWERSTLASTDAQIFYAPLTEDGIFAEQPVQVSPADAQNCKQPEIFEYEGFLSVLWFDERRGVETVYLAQKMSFLWEETRISSSSFDALFAVPLLLNGNFEIVWQQNQRNGSASITLLTPDRSIQNPSIVPLSYAEGRRSTAQRVEYRVQFPEDSSGIAGYSYSWSQNKYINPPQMLMALTTNPTVELTANRDGVWYMKVAVTDYAGNWSDFAEQTYYLDTTPPLKPRITAPLVDNNGFVDSNSFTINWDKNTRDNDVIGGYTYTLQYVDYVSPTETFTRFTGSGRTTVPSEYQDAIERPPARLLTTQTQASFTNIDNGMYAFSVAAIDEVGNIGDFTTMILYFNKYIPYTIVNAVNSQTDDAGIIDLNLVGRGYLANGYISAVYLDRDGEEPYDRILTLDDDDFSIISDTIISNITLSEVAEGTYRIGLLHTDRGLYMTRPVLSVSEYGTVKFGDYSTPYITNIRAIDDSNLFTIEISDILVIIFTFFTLIGTVVSIRGITSAAKDAVQVRYEIQALLTGDRMPSEKKEQGAKLKQKGISLRYKLIGFTASLVLMIILLVSLPLGYYMINTQEETLASGLESQINVLLDSLSSGARAYLPQQNILELGYLPSQSEAMDEALYATITGGPSSGDNVNLDFIWATNRPNIEEYINTETLVYGQSRDTDEISQVLSPQLTELNTLAAEQVGVLSSEIEQLTREALTLVLNTDAASVRRREEIQTVITQMDNQVSLALNDLAKQGVGSYPAFDNTNLSSDVTEYIFYKPVLYRQGTEQNFVRGTVQVAVTTESLLDSIGVATRSVLYITLIIALIAISIGVFGSLILASIIINPIRKLASHVQLIRDTEDKEELEGKEIEVKSRDEIGLLGEIVNDMTSGLIKAASAAKDLTVGKELQKMFIPLETDSEGKKLTTGKKTSKNLEFFGYYEGAKGVSGDYFDVVDLDGRHYAVIKCDVAGKGVPASLIMVEVATLFLDYFKDWTLKTHGYNMSAFVSRVNDMIESRGFKGRFAAFSLCIIDSETGDTHFCNAGDNMLHFYDAQKRKKITELIPETPATGVFPSFMVEMQGGYKMVKRKLKQGDVLFMYTDGIEEAKRMFRDADYNEILCEEGGQPVDTPHAYHSVGQDGEEMSADRVNDIIETIFARGVYKLEKFHSPVENELFEFDFSSCTGTVEDCLMGLVSIEKIFRMYRPKNPTEYDRVLVDRKVDEYLQKHFKQYAQYCSNKADHAEHAEYLWYTYMTEDPQYDDLTLLGLQKL